MTDQEIKKKFNLTPKQFLFGKYYVSNGHNGLQACKSAGYKGNDKTLSVIAVQNLAKLNIKEFIDSLEAPVLEKLNIDENWVLSQLKSFASSKITDYFTIKNNTIKLKDFDELTEDQIRAVESIKETKNGIEIKLVNKESAVVNIGKHLGMFKEQIEGNVNHNLTHRVYVIPSFGGNFTDPNPQNPKP